MPRLTEWVVANRSRLDRLLLIAAVVAPILAVAAGIAHYVATRDVAGIRFLVLYVAPMFLAAPLWLRQRLIGIEQRSAAMHAVDAGVFILSVARFVVGELLPFSGHMLFLTYSGITVRAAGYRLLVTLLIVETSIFKLVLWHDPMSWSVGLGLGALAALVATALDRRSRIS